MIGKYDPTTGQIVTLAGGTRLWIGTQSAHDTAVANGTMPNNVMVCITDDYVDEKITDITENITLRDANISGGSIKVFRKGSLVIVIIYNLLITSSATSINSVLATGLPLPFANQDVYNTVSGNTSLNVGQVCVTKVGVLNTGWGMVENCQYTGELVYFTED